LALRSRGRYAARVRVDHSIRRTRLAACAALLACARNCNWRPALARGERVRARPSTSCALDVLNLIHPLPPSNRVIATKQLAI
jgi:hypothetical protein